MTLETASRLFAEAREWTSGRVKYLAEDSEIRQMALDTYHQQHVMHLQRVCDDIYYVLACEFMDFVDER